MTSSENSSAKPSALKRLAAALALISFIGFLDAGFLTAVHYLDGAPPCSVLEGCEKVTTSSYAVVWGVPLALFGAVYYLLIFLLTAAYFESGREGIIYSAARLTVIGFLASLYFVYLQIFVIEAVCLYCLVSAAAATALFILGALLMKKRYRFFDQTGPA